MVISYHVGGIILAMCRIRQVYGRKRWHVYAPAAATAALDEGRAVALRCHFLPPQKGFSVHLSKREWGEA